MKSKQLFKSSLLSLGNLMQKPILTPKTIGVNHSSGGLSLINNFVIFLLLSLIFFGITTPPESLATAHSDSYSVSQIHDQSTTPTDSSASDCDHEGLPCHSCHLGHCSFELTDLVIFSIKTKLNTHLRSQYSIETSNFGNNLFRPPIFA